MKAHEMMRKWLSLGVALGAGLGMAQGATGDSSATSGRMMIDTRAGKGAIETDRAEGVTYSNLWEDETNATATVTLNGEIVVDRAAKEGVYSWTPEGYGTYVFTHQTTQNGQQVGETQTATVTFVSAFSSATSGRMTIDTRAGKGVIEVVHAEDVTYSNLWDGDADATATVTLDGEVVVTNAAEEGVYSWAPEKYGTYVFTHQTTQNGQPVGETLTATVALVSAFSSATSGKMTIDTRAGKGVVIDTDHAEDITFSNLWDGETDATATVTLDGEAVVTKAASEGVYRWTPTKGGKYVFTHKTLKKDGSPVGEELTATFFFISHIIEIDDGTDGQGGANSSFSYSGVYDGKGHGITVDASRVKNPKITYSRGKNGPYMERLLLTNACEVTTIWYLIRAEGYDKHYINKATVTIAKRPVLVKSWNRSKVYDGKPLELTEDAITVSNLVAGQSFEYDDLAQRTAEGRSAATFTVEEGEHTDLGNYEVTKEYGWLRVMPAASGGNPAANTGLTAGESAEVTKTTPVPVPYAWLDSHLGETATRAAAKSRRTSAREAYYEAAAHATGANGVPRWESYVAGLEPEVATSRLRAFIAFEKDGTPRITWSPDLSTNEPRRVYTVYGKPTLDASDWTPVTDANRKSLRFFKVTVDLEGND